MKLKGFINAVRPALDSKGNQRSFETKDHEKFVCWEVEIDVKRYDENGSEYKEEFLAEYNTKESEGKSAPFVDLVGKNIECEIFLSFSRREWNDRKFMSTRLFSVTRKEG